MWARRLRSMSCELLTVWTVTEPEQAVLCKTVVTYRRHDGYALAPPSQNVIRLRQGRIAKPSSRHTVVTLDRPHRLTGAGIPADRGIQLHLRPRRHHSACLPADDDQSVTPKFTVTDFDTTTPTPKSVIKRLPNQQSKSGTAERRASVRSAGTRPALDWPWTGSTGEDHALVRAAVLVPR